MPDGQRVSRLSRPYAGEAVQCQPAFAEIVREQFRRCNLRAMRYIAGIKNHAIESSRNLADPFGDFVAVGDVTGGLPVGGKVFLEKRMRLGRIFSLELRRLFNQLTLFPLIKAGSAKRFVLEQVNKRCVITPIQWFTRVGVTESLQVRKFVWLQCHH